VAEEGLPEFESEMHRQSSRGAANGFGFLSGGELNEGRPRQGRERGAARAESRGGHRRTALWEKTRRPAGVGDGSAGSGGEADAGGAVVVRFAGRVCLSWAGPPIKISPFAPPSVYVFLLNLHFS
jgi:hypothetical protein